MPKWVYDNKTMTMVPQKKTGIDFVFTGEGIRVTDYDKHVEFVITRDDRCKLPGRNIEADCKRFDPYEARRIADRVRRMYPGSKYVDFRYFARGFENPVEESLKLSSEDKALLRSISESYEPGNVLQYVEHLNEETGTLLNVGHTASTEHNFKDHKRGFQGLIQAAPSAILSFLVCPPAALLALIGAVHRRAEQRWAKAMFNHNRWKDFVAYPAERKKAADEVRKKMAENCKYYYTRLANGEILRVVGCSTLEAKEMIMAVEHKEIIERYKKYNENLELTNPDEVNIKPKTANDEGKDYIMWVIKFDNGEVCYAFGAPDANDKEQIMEDAVKSRKIMVDYYKKIIYNDEDNDKEKKQKHPVGIDKETDEMTDQEKRLFAVPKIDDMIRIENPSSYKIIDDSNYKDFSEPTTSAPTWNPEGRTIYRFRIGNMRICRTPFIVFNLPLINDVEAKTICSYLSEESRSFANYINKVETFLQNNITNVKYYKCVTENNDYIHIPVFNNENASSVMNKDDNFEITSTDFKETANRIFDSISDAIEEANSSSPKISQVAKKDYMTNYKKRNRVIPSSGPSGIDEDENGNALDLYKDWKNYIYYQSINSRTKEALDEPQLYRGGTAHKANNIEPPATPAETPAETPDASTKQKTPYVAPTSVEKTLQDKA